MNKLSIKLLLSFIGAIIFIAYIWYRFIRQRLPKDIPFHQYKMGNILLLIETIVLKGNGTFLLDNISFSAINHTSSFENIDLFNSDDSEVLTGQKNCDFFATRGYVNDNETIMDTFYHDVKMYQSGALSGRITLQPGLVGNKKIFREYITKYQTSFKQLNERIKNYEVALPKNHPIFQLCDEIEISSTEILRKLLKMLENKHKNLSADDKQKCIDLLQKFNAILTYYLLKPEIRSLTNIGISNDPGSDDVFGRFYYEKLEKHISSTEYLNKFNYKTLFSSSFYRADHRKQLQIILESFPPEVARQAIKSLKYIDYDN